MKKQLLLFVTFFSTLLLHAQQTPQEIENLLERAHEIMDTHTDSAFVLGQNCLAVSLKINYKNGEASAYTIIGRVYRRRGKYLPAIENQVKALKIFEQTGDSIKIASTCNNIAIIYILLHDYEKVIEYEKQGLKVLEKVKNISNKDSTRFVNMNNQLGAASFELSRYDEALAYFSQALQYAKNLNDKDGQAISYQNIAKVYLTQRDFEKALENAKKSYAMQTAVNDPISSAYALAMIASVYGEKGDYANALKYFTQVGRIADSTGYLELKKFMLRDLAELYEKTNNYKKALYYLRQFITMNDTLLNLETKSQIAEVETQYQFEKKQQENEFLKQQNALQQTNLQQASTQKQWLIVGLSTLVLLTGIIIFFLIKGYNRNRQLKRLVEEKNNIMSVLSHDMRAPLVKINNVVELQQSNPTKDFVPIKNIVDEGLNMLSNILDVNYLEGSAPQPRTSEIDILELAQECVEENLENANRKQIGIGLDINVDTIVIYSDRIMLKRVLDNLVSNAIKYSYPGSQVRVSINNTRGDKILVAIADNGQGIREDEKERLFTKYARLSTKPTAGETSTGLGLYISNWLVQLLKGRIWCESEFNSGSVFYVELPVTIAQPA